MHINKKFHPPLSDGERINRLEQAVKLQSITIFLLAVSVTILSWRMNQFTELIQLNSDELLLATQRVQQLERIYNALQKLVTLFS